MRVEHGLGCGGAKFLKRPPRPYCQGRRRSPRTAAVTFFPRPPSGGAAADPPPEKKNNGALSGPHRPNPRLPAALRADTGPPPTPLPPPHSPVPRAGAAAPELRATHGARDQSRPGPESPPSTVPRGDGRCEFPAAVTNVEPRLATGIARG